MERRAAEAAGHLPPCNGSPDSGSHSQPTS
jgi:hypothetical protein